MDVRNADRTLRMERRGEREIVMTRAFRAPALAVFDAWTKPEQLKRWFGPPSWSLPVCEIDLRVGGAWRFVMQKDDGSRMELKGVYREIVPGVRLVSTESFEPAWYDGESVNTMTFEEKAGVTTMEVVARYDTQAIRDGVLGSNAQSGADASYDRLEQLLDGTRALVVTHVFDAPVERVWQAWTTDELVRRWWGPTGFTAPVARMDVREGGTSLVAMRSPDGHDMYSTWAYTEVVPLRRFAYVFNLSDEKGAKLDPTSIGMPPDFPKDAKHVVTFKPKGKQTEMTMTEHGYRSDQLLALSKLGLEQCLDKMDAVLADR